MKKFVCSVCGNVEVGDKAPDKCPVCGAPACKFVEKECCDKVTFSDEHKVGIAQGCSQEIIEGLRENFTAECTEVGMYLAMSRQADREGYPEIGEACKRIAYEEAEHAAKCAELLGEIVTPSTKQNLEKRLYAEQGATDGKVELARIAKEQNQEAIQDSISEMAKDEARHGRIFEGLLNRYFNK